MIFVPFLLCLLLSVTAFLGLRAGNVSGKAFRKLGVPVLGFAGLCFVLMLLVRYGGGQSTPLKIAIVNSNREKTVFYILTVYYPHESNDTNRIIQERIVLWSGEQTTRTIEFDGADGFWVVGMNDADSVVYFETNEEKEYFGQIRMEQSLVEDHKKIRLARQNILVYNRERIIRNILITLNALLTLLILLEILAPKWVARKLGSFR